MCELAIDIQECSRSPLNGLTEMRTWAIYVYMEFGMSKGPASEKWRMAHVDFLVEEPFLEVLVDSFVGDRAQQCHVRHTSRFLL